MSERQPQHRRALAALFAARSIAVIGASADPERIGGRLVAYLKRHFDGNIYPVNPRRTEIQGLAAYPSVTAVGTRIDLALISVPASAAVEALSACAEVGIGAAIVFSSGFAEAGAEGEKLQTRIRGVAETSGMAILGPNCLGAMDVRTGVTATFSLALDVAPLRPGNVAVVSQSGAFAAHVLALTGQRGLGLSKWVTTGNESVLDAADIIAFLAGDAATDVIMLYLEGCRDGAKLRAALDRARRAGKPVIAIKVGRSEEGARAALSHTAAIAGADEGFEALFRATGVCRVKSVDDFVDVAAAAAAGRLPAGRRLGLVSMSGGVGILMADRCADFGLAVPALPPALQERLSTLLPHSSVANPIDVTAQIINEPHLFAQAVDAVLDSGACDALAIFLTTLAHAPRLREPLMNVFRELRAKHPESVLGICMLAPEAVRRELSELGYIQIDEPSRLIETLGALADIRGALEARDVPGPIASPELYLPLDGGALSEHAAKAILARAGLPFAEERLARSAAQARRAARAIGFPVVVKLASPDIAHKSEIGGVVLGLWDDEAVAAAYDRVLARASEAAPEAEVEGVLVAAMLTGGHELIVGGHIDEVAGPLVTVGVGGVFVEVLRDTVSACAPIDPAAATQLIGRLKIAPILAGARGRPKADLPVLAEIVARLSQIVAANADQIDSLEINPLLVRAEGEGALGLDALIVSKRTMR
ncbi:acetate--CoA ligase family protein [Afifella pfennigii]|uniref:acetate--CoA ligase family protein n=1 Tax=Afifella pfennigii TaxID=209897 RepID=UPI0004789F2E|nr:acetate--CoA ligase family protein [Afifella pfennigii]